MSKVLFYDEPSVPELGLDGLVGFVRKTVGIGAERRRPILSHATPETPVRLAAARIHRLNAPFVRHKPTREEILFEEREIGQVRGSVSNITLYDGVELQNVLGELVPKGELSQDIFHVIFTRKLGCTYDTSDCRYHGRALICSNPSVISTTGMIEAPAKPREYYAELIAMSRMGINTDALKQKYAGRFLEYHDERLPAIAEGYLLQALLYYVSGEPFCSQRDCRLFNAHWQSDLLHSQITTGTLCARHQKALDSVKDLN